ncbi:LPS export ABC transporter periplasmic protein LptC [Mucilaginibacter terrae]|uniref:LPS export ABC transporter periplasmic protein LptC n=1 Tax=Mucilaginibacter terrae TaxID=1955052 RepID=UPI00362B238A
MINIFAFLISKGYWLAFIAGLLLFSACENDMKDIQKISSQEVSKPINRTTGLDVIYSDSAKVKSRLTAPLLLEYTDKHFREMPKGLKIVSYDSAKGMKEAGQIMADYGIERQNDKIIELRRNVVATNIQGQTFKSDELIWDQNKKIFYSNKPVQITFADGTIFYGTGASSNESMYPWTIQNTTGQIPVNQNFGQ